MTRIPCSFMRHYLSTAAYFRVVTKVSLSAPSEAQHGEFGHVPSTLSGLDNSFNGCPDWPRMSDGADHAGARDKRILQRLPQIIYRTDGKLARKPLQPFFRRCLAKFLIEHGTEPFAIQPAGFRRGKARIFQQVIPAEVGGETGPEFFASCT